MDASHNNSTNEFLSHALLISCAIEDFGQSIEHFHVIGLIGAGAFSEVLKVESKSYPGYYFALKRWNRKFRSIEDRDRMLTEAKILKKVNEFGDNKTAPKIYCAWQENSMVHMLMEFAEYGSVANVIQRHNQLNVPIPDAFIWWVLHDIAQGMMLMHSNSYVHMDIKPANLMIFSDRTIRLSDFGLTCQVGISHGDERGDPKYMAKEILHDRARQPSVDIFSLGLTVFEIAQANTDFQMPHPFDGAAHWHELRDGRAPALVGRPLEISKLVHRMLDPIAEIRPTAKELTEIPEICEYSAHLDRMADSVLIDAIIPKSLES